MVEHTLGIQVNSPKNLLFLLNFPIVRHHNLGTEYESELKMVELKGQFDRFLFDPGLNRRIELSQDTINQIKEINPGYNLEVRTPRQILTRKSILRIATSEIIHNKNIGFVNFDIKDLRWGDKAGFGDIILSDFVGILDEVAEEMRRKHQDDPGYNFIPGRVGGDEFCFFVSSSSSSKIDKKELQESYDKVRKKFEEKKGYYLFSEDQLTNEGENNKNIREIYKNVKAEERYRDLPEDNFFKEKSSQVKLRKKTNHLKNEGEEKRIIVANDGETRKVILVRSIAHGRVPEKTGLTTGEINLSPDEIKKAKARLENKYDFKLEKTPEELIKNLNNYLKKHPELEAEITKIKELTKSEKFNLASYLFYIIREYGKDPLLDKLIFGFTDLIDHIGKISPDERENFGFMKFHYNPWIKVLNGDKTIGYDKTDGVIITTDKTLESSIKPRHVLARGRGDYVTLVPRHDENIDNVIDIVDHENIPEGNPLFKGMPIFTFTTKIHFDENINKGQVIKNCEDGARNNFYIWLNKYYDQSQQPLIRYYLSERTNERIGSLLYWLGTFKQPNQDFIEFLIREKLEFQKKMSKI